MKKQYLINIISLLLVFVIGLSSPITCLAQNDGNSQQDTYADWTDYNNISPEQIENLKQIFENLSPAAKKLYEESLYEDPDLLDFHKKYINPNMHVEMDIPTTNDFDNYKSQYNNYIYDSKSAVSARGFAPTANELSNLYNSLKNLNLPAEVYTALKMFISSMAAAAADGPLPAGEVATLITGAGLITVVALNWDKISPKWDKIKALIINTFKKCKAGITKALGDATKEIKNKAKNNKDDGKTKPSKSAWNKSAKDALGKLSQNDKNHILNNKKHDHKWYKLFGGKKPSWNDISPILLKVLEQGKETQESGNVYNRTLSYKGCSVVVRFVKNNGLIKYISTAFVK